MYFAKTQQINQKHGILNIKVSIRFLSNLYAELSIAMLLGGQLVYEESTFLKLCIIQSRA